MDDIVVRLRGRSKLWESNGELDEFCTDAMWDKEAADKIEQLRVALQLAVGELSTYNEYRLVSPEGLYLQFLENAYRG